MDRKEEILREQLKVDKTKGCTHNQIRIDGKDVGTCVKCGVKMKKTWQPNCG